jgi:flagellar biosynthesis protein FlhA
MLRDISRQTDILMAIGLIGLIGMMLVPLPPVLLDLLLATNLALALCILLLGLYIRRALDFSVFPSLLLVTTLFRLALNISSTRLILLHANAGRVIECFGNFVIGGDLLVGSVIFLILVVIQFVVITNGAGRVAEVAARFTLDEMPGKQMSIDADLNAGLITEAQARQRRLEIEREADFYGAMDGASKFVKGDAIAGVIIVAVNIIGGLAIGAGRMGMPLGEALQRYALLTVGDGLVSQLPALLISTATGIVVTRSASENDLGNEAWGQFSAYPRALGIAGAMLLSFGLVPGLPKLSFMLLGGLAGVMAWQVSRQQQSEAPADELPSEAQRSEVEDEAVLEGVDRLSLEIGFGLIGLLEDRSGPGLLSRITALRRQLSRDLGLPVPAVRVRDDLGLEPNEYVIRLRGTQRARGMVRPGSLLAIPSRADVPPLPGEEAREPVFDLPAWWINTDQRLQAETRGYTVVEPAAVLATHLSETVRRHAAEVLSRQDVAEMIEQIRGQEPAVVNELVPELTTVGQVHLSLRELLSEGFSLRDLTAVLEAYADGLRLTGSPEQAVERVRASQAEALCEQLCGADGKLLAVSVAPALEQAIEEAVIQTPEGPLSALAPEILQHISTELAGLLNQLAQEGREAVLLTSPASRRLVRAALARFFPQIRILSYAELAPRVQVSILRQLSLPPSPALNTA